MRAPDYIGYWYCETCGSRMRAKAVLEDPLSYPPCPTCQVGKTHVDRRREPRPASDAPADPARSPR